MTSRNTAPAAGAMFGTAGVLALLGAAPADGVLAASNVWLAAALAARGACSCCQPSFDSCEACTAGTRIRPLKSDAAATAMRTVRLDWHITMRSVEVKELPQGGALQRLPPRMNLVGVAQLLVGRGGVVGPDRLPRWSEALDVLAQNPRADVGIDAPIKQVGARDPIPAQARQVDRVDLHEADILRTVAIAIRDPRPHARLLQRDAPEQGGADPMELRGIIEAVGTSCAGQQGGCRERHHPADLHSATLPGCSLNRTCGERST
ncbi:protein of unknown function (plasmid) [Cupriavidus taiwanensis]|uniref:Uncharacterized protein n=1 Tax=Cupriavidus taiwanensis TaxID=164546 RepID=A0A375GKK6_9BURK|nr:exported hypothetical protein [Cupriavidus taiwanensis]SOZ95991.1 exported hypothetical protein [Cupriavidus taiwanensis]SPC24861.1 exported hypothetical protein [Cupriavidus taiwanensis]SPC25436.1 exported hypothetical protein [Cupriavidus taiwanensis]SPD37221.1 protein of unknown function [Cupriavidus taiwanensis]